MIWFAILLFTNYLVPGGVMNGDLGVMIGGVRVTLMDAMIFLSPLVTFLPAYSRDAHLVSRTHPAFRWAMGLLLVSFVVAAIQGFFQVRIEDTTTIKWYLDPLRNYLVLPVAMYYGYVALRRPAQCKMAVLVIFIASLLSAVSYIIFASTTVTELSTSQTFDALRDTREHALGDAGCNAAALIIFCMVSGIRLVPIAFAVPLLGVATAGMLFITHRSVWVCAAVVMLFSVFCMHKGKWSKKFSIFVVSSVLLIGVAITAIGIVDSHSNKDFAGWIGKRLNSLLPDAESKEARAWDSRTDGLLLDIKLWASSPVFGGGFGNYETNAMRTGEWLSFKHTNWTAVLAETGLLGLAAILIMIGGLVILGRRTSQQAHDRWMALLGAQVALFGVYAGTMGWLSGSWASARLALNLGLMVGLCFRCRDLHNSAAALPLADFHAEVN